MIRKSGKRFSLATNPKRVCAQIMLKRRDEIMIRLHLSDHDPVRKARRMRYAGMRAAWHPLARTCAYVFPTVVLRS
jgi:hypothetical protein